MTPLLAGLLLGAAGSGHCAGMCGPLVLTLGRPWSRPSRRAQLRHALLYHAGRLLAYMALALPAGLLGEALALRGFGRAVAIGSGALLLGAAIGSVGPRVLGRAGQLASAAAARACGAAGSWSLAHPLAGPVLTGAANGLLPCGLVYAAVLAAAGTGATAHALALMLGFGLGTAPVLLTLSLSAAAVPPGVRLRLRRLTPVVLALTAALLLARGLAAPEPHPHGHAPPAAARH